MRMNYLKTLAWAASLPAMLAASASAFAQSAPDDDESFGVGEIIVTAQRKVERLQEVPISVNVVSGDELSQRGIVNTLELPTLVPGLTFVSQGPAFTPFLRGVGSNSGNPNDEPSVATYVDGVYIAASDGNALALANVERIEVLKGPQGTLFGRNATGGVVQVITKDPQQEIAGEFKVGYANYNTVSGSAYLTGGLSETIAMDIAAHGSHQGDGWGRNATRNDETYKTRTWGISSKIKFTPSETFTAKLAGDYHYYSGNAMDYRSPVGVLAIDGLPSPAGLYDTRAGVVYRGNRSPVSNVKQYGLSLNLDYDMGFARLVSITAYRHDEAFYLAEADQSPLPIVDGDLPRLQENYSQELQLLSPEDSKIDWTLGLYYYQNKAGYVDYSFSGLAFSNPPFSGIGLFQGSGLQYTKSYSAYAQATVPLGEMTKFTAGIRYTDENQRSESSAFGNPLPQQRNGFNKATWRLALDHGFTEDIHVYASYNRGVKAGGFDLLPPSLGQTPFFPEVLDAYEVGFKSTLLDNKLRFNAALFWNAFQNIQVQNVAPGGGGVSITSNAAKARIRGVDVDFEFVPQRGLSFSGGFSYIDGKYQEFDNTPIFAASPLAPFAYAANGGPCKASSPPSAPPNPFPSTCLFDASGQPVIRTPKFSGNFTAAYKIESSAGNFPLSVTVSHNSGFSFEAFNRLRQDAYTLVNASAGWRSSNDKFGITFWVNNLTKEYYYAQAVSQGLGDAIAPAAPRTFGVTLSTKLGG